MTPTPLTLDRVAEGAAYDVVVVGAGGAGMAAALFSALEGQRVLLVERTGLLGGTTALSAATTWIPGSQHAASVGRGGGHAGEGRGIPAPDRRQPLQRGDAPGLPAQRPRRHRPAGGGDGGAFPRPPAASRLHPGGAGGDAVRPRAGAAALRRAAARRGAGAGAAADPGVHRARRHDGGPGRHPAPAGPGEVLGLLPLLGEAARPLRPGPAAARPRHAAADGQRAGRPAARLAARAGRGHPGGHAGARRWSGARTGASGGWCSRAGRHAPADRRAPRRDHGHGRLQPAPEAPGGDAARPDRRAQPRRARATPARCTTSRWPPAPATARARWTTPSGRRSRCAGARTAAPPSSRTSCWTAASRGR